MVVVHAHQIDNPCGGRFLEMIQEEIGEEEVAEIFDAGKYLKTVFCFLSLLRGEIRGGAIYGNKRIDQST